MPTYKSIPVSRWSSPLEEEVLSPETMTVHEVTPEATYTGLYDHQGNPIYRMKGAIGFRLKGVR